MTRESVQLMMRWAFTRSRRCFGLYANALLLAVGAMACSHQSYATRTRPAEVDLHDVKRIAVSEISGEGGSTLESEITQGLVQSQQFDVLNSSDFERVKKETSFNADRAKRSEFKKLSRRLENSAVLTGKVLDSKYKESISTRSSSCPKANGSKFEMVPCTEYTRTGKCSYVADVKLISVKSGAVIVSRQLQSHKSVATTSDKDQPEPIDEADLRDSCRRDAAQQFLHMVAPFSVQEEVDFETDGDLSELDLGNRYLRAGDHEHAVAMYKKAARSADEQSGLSEMTRAKAHYSLGLGLALSGDYAHALAELKQANQLSGDAKWLEFETRVRQWQAEAERLNGKH
jgi:tetratricopeptide (TPR) repeat protein